MNTNIKVTLNDQQRNHIKNLIDGKPSSKMASRQEVSNLVEMFVEQLVDSKMTKPKEIVQEAVEKVSGYKFYADGQEIDYDKWINIPCDDCGCMVSVADAVIQQLNTN
jgi:hypothetical protein|tara:strand:+ start:292 stop:615 length:324 start_codon:yes stop_codon:yes gene_type:complete